MAKTTEKRDMNVDHLRVEVERLVGKFDLPTRCRNAILRSVMWERGDYARARRLATAPEPRSAMEYLIGLSIGDYIIRECSDVCKGALRGALENHSLEHDGVWRPIDVAPRNGTKILAITQGGVMCVMHYDSEMESFVRSVTCRRCSGFSLADLAYWHLLPDAPTQMTEL